MVEALQEIKKASAYEEQRITLETKFKETYKERLQKGVF
jgi:hypothetical protein